MNLIGEPLTRSAIYRRTPSEDRIIKEERNTERGRPLWHYAVMVGVGVGAFALSYWVSISGQESREYDFGSQIVDVREG
jgi:hypothetical protein